MAWRLNLPAGNDEGAAGDLHCETIEYCFMKLDGRKGGELENQPMIAAA